jgi:hypothetical protein
VTFDPTQPILDVRGRTIAIGSTVAFPRHYGSRTWLVVGRVVALETRKAAAWSDRLEPVVVVEGPDRYGAEDREHRTGKLDQLVVVEAA